jgi:hypothetical protein
MVNKLVIMNLDHFRLLSKKEQFELLSQHGVYVGKRKEDEMTTVLYQLDTYYVEIFYKQYRKYVSHVRFFTTTDEIQPYLEQIDVQRLIRCMN